MAQCTSGDLLPGHPDEHTAFLRFLFPKHCDRTEGVLTVSVKANVHSRWYPRHPAFSLQISAQNGSCDMSMCISTAQPRTKRAWQSWGAAFPHLLKFQHKKALVACPCAFRLWNGRRSRGARHYSCSESLRTDLATEASFREILYKELLWTPCTEILPRGLLQRSCQQSSYRDLAQRSCRDRRCIEICCRDLANRVPIESLYRNLIEKSCQEISYRDVQRSCQETS